MAKEDKKITYEDYRKLWASDESNLPYEEREFFRNLYFRESDKEKEARAKFMKLNQSKLNEKIKKASSDIPTEKGLGILKTFFIATGMIIIYAYVGFWNSDLETEMMGDSEGKKMILFIFLVFLISLFFFTYQKLQNYSDLLAKLYRQVESKYEYELEQEFNKEYEPQRKKNLKRFYKDGKD